ncbi:MAG: acyl-phosphate glycerol 3-phosphate acyltransferase [Acidimicrobiaceae bacterium]|nr:acyl-phosphate glycerol 3-phosphate acyltransferase [Acidimicrobiaceae bacterium]
MDVGASTGIRLNGSRRGDAVGVNVVHVALVVGAYLLGTLPSAHYVAGRRGFDPTREGSGNPGATNVFRVAGTRAGMIVFAADMGKGAVATTAGLIVGGRSLATVCWAAAVVGHVLPVTRRFRGGKGVATAGGGAWVLFGTLAAIGTVIFLVVARLTRKVSVASLATAVSMVLLIILSGVPLLEALVATALTVLLFVRHQSNVRRLIAGDEGSWGSGS